MHLIMSENLFYTSIQKLNTDKDPLEQKLEEIYFCARVPTVYLSPKKILLSTLIYYCRKIIIEFQTSKSGV